VSYELQCLQIYGPKSSARPTVELDPFTSKLRNQILHKLTRMRRLQCCRWTNHGELAKFTVVAAHLEISACNSNGVIEATISVIRPRIIDLSLVVWMVVLTLAG
jgi:hypothetical protein